MKRFVSVLLLVVLFTLAIGPCALAATTTVSMSKTSNGKDLLDKTIFSAGGITNTGKVTIKQSGGKFEVKHNGKTETTPYAVLKVTLRWKVNGKNVFKSATMKGSSVTISGLPKNEYFCYSIDYQGSLIEDKASWLDWTLFYSKPKWVTAPKVTFTY